jgi:hypothetical protein
VRRLKSRVEIVLVGKLALRGRLEHWSIEVLVRLIILANLAVEPAWVLAHTAHANILEILVLTI